MNKVVFFTGLFLMLFSVRVNAQSAVVRVDEDAQLTELLELNARLIKSNKIGHRYKIQIGSFSSLKDAEQTKSKFESENSSLPVQLQYESPNYKVWVGDFTTRLSADRVFLQLKNKYKSAFVFKPSN